MEANSSSGRPDSARNARRDFAGGSRGFGEPPIPFKEFAKLIDRPDVTEEEICEGAEQLALGRQQVDPERERYRDLFEFAPDGDLITDLRGIIRDCNRAGAGLLGQPKHQLIGKPLATFVAAEDRPAYRRRLRVLRRLERAGEWELGLRSREGGRVFAGVTVALVRDRQGNPAALSWLLRDITQRRRVEKALAESEERHRFLTEHAQDAIYLFRFLPEYHLDYVSPAISKITGHTPEDFYRDWTLVRELVHPADLPLLDQYAKNADDLATPVSVRLRRKNGEEVWVEQHATLITDETGRPVAVEAIVRDVTERVKTEVQLERLRTEFLVVLAHEIRTPLTGIKGSAAIGLSPETPPKPREAQELFKIIDEQADRLRELVSNLLDITQIESGLLSLNLEDVDIDAVLKESFDAFARGSEVRKLVLDVPRRLPRVAVDRRRIGQVLSNLLLNAAHASPIAEPIVVSARREEGTVLVQVRDHGRGIPSDKLPMLFRKFYKVDEIADKGVGLGLAICKGIVEAHGGRIWAESGGKDSGATINFTLPSVA